MTYRSMGYIILLPKILMDLKLTFQDPREFSNFVIMYFVYFKIYVLLVLRKICVFSQTKYQKEVDRLEKENKDLRKQLNLMEQKTGKKRKMNVSIEKVCLKQIIDVVVRFLVKMYMGKQLCICMVSEQNANILFARSSLSPPSHDQRTQILVERHVVHSVWMAGCHQVFLPIFNLSLLNSRENLSFIMSTKQRFANSWQFHIGLVKLGVMTLDLPKCVRGDIIIMFFCKLHLV